MSAWDYGVDADVDDEDEDVVTDLCKTHKCGCRNEVVIMIIVEGNRLPRICTEA